MNKPNFEKVKHKSDENDILQQKSSAFSAYKIEKDYQTVYYFLKDSGFSENFITNLRKVKGFILINDQIATTKSVLPKGSVLSICNNPNPKTAIMQCILPLDIVYEDAYYLLLNKPANISTMPNRSHYSNNLAGAICGYMQNKQPGFTLRILNRLDKDTSGLILVAKNAIAQKEIKDIEKTYLAICEGKIDKACTISKPILTLQENGVNARKRVISEKGQKAETFITPLKFLDDSTLLSIRLHFGRTHQIRVHLSSIGHPLIGDQIYGKKSEKINRTALHCSQMSFFHPYLKKKLSFTASLPQDFANLLDRF